MNFFGENPKEKGEHRFATPSLAAKNEVVGSSEERDLMRNKDLPKLRKPSNRTYECARAIFLEKMKEIDTWEEVSAAAEDSLRAALIFEEVAG